MVMQILNLLTGSESEINFLIEQNENLTLDFLENAECTPETKLLQWHLLASFQTTAATVV